MSRDFDDRTVLVTGAASGIGAAAATLFAAQGAMVICADINIDAARAKVADIATAGGKATAVELDLSNENSVAELMQSIASDHGRLDAAFNNAGISDVQHSWIDFPTDKWQRMLDGNLNSVFYCLKHELKLMVAQDEKEGLRGQIVNTSSGAGLIAAPGQPHYTAAKHAIIGLTRSAASEFSRQGIRVNTLCPGLTDTAMIYNQPEDMLKMGAMMSPTGKLGQAIDVAQAAVWLCSPVAQWVNGQSIIADGGGLMH